MKIEEGKFYRSRAGKKIGPMMLDPFEPAPQFRWRTPTDKEGRWDDDGRDGDSWRLKCSTDLVADWLDKSNSEASALNSLISTCHNASYDAGWWHHADTGLPYIPGDNCTSGEPWQNLNSVQQGMILHYWPIFVACKIGLIHSEVSEGFEAYRRGANDDKLAHRLGLETEIADSMIRQFDLMGAMQRATRLGVVDPSTHAMNLSVSFFEKMSFNVSRPDHQLATRRAAGGKAF